MKKLFVVLSLAFVFCFTFSCQQGEEAAEEPAEQLIVDIAAEEAAIQEAFIEMSKAGPAKDATLFVSYMTEDVVLAGGGNKEFIHSMYSEWFSEGNYFENGSIEKIEISASGDLAYTVCMWDRFLVERPVAKYSRILVWKKQADGTWKVTAF